jgi:hypothetical protein
LKSINLRQLYCPINSSIIFKSFVKTRRLSMSIKRNHFAMLMFLLFLSFIIVLFSHSLGLAQWTSVTLPAECEFWELYGVHFTSANEGWAVGWDVTNSRGGLLHYQSGIWTSVIPPVVTAYWGLWGVHFASADEGWAVGWGDGNARAVLLHYQNGIWTWVPLPSVTGSGSQLRGIHFPSTDEGWAVGDNYGDTSALGLLLHYQNGNWTSVSPPTLSRQWGLTQVHFTSATEGWAVGYDYWNDTQILLHYKDGNWIFPSTESDNNDLRAVHFISANEGWVVGHDSNGGGALLHFKDGAWTLIIPPTVDEYWDLEGVHFTSPDEGWAVGESCTFGSPESGVLLHYKDGTWTSVRPPAVSADWDLRAVHFTSANEGWAVGLDHTNTRGVLLHYSFMSSPNEGTVGTQITIRGTGLGTKKGKVLIGGVATKIAKDGWKPDSITCTVTKVPSVGTHNVTIKPYKADEIVLSDAFNVKPPEIHSLDFYEGFAGTPITITGNYFGTKKRRYTLSIRRMENPRRRTARSHPGIWTPSPF